MRNGWTRRLRYSLAAVVVLTAGWGCFGVGHDYLACRTALRNDNERLAAIDARLSTHLDALGALLRRGPLDPSGHEIDRLIAIDDPTPDGFDALGRWLDPSVPVPMWNGDQTPIPQGLPDDVVFRLKLTEFGNVWMQAGIIAVHLAVPGEADQAMARNHQAALVRELDWLDAIRTRAPRPALGATHCLRW